MADTDTTPNGDPAYIVSLAERSVADVYSGRQSIVDRCGALVNYKLLFRHEQDDITRRYALPPCPAWSQQAGGPRKR
ncbi:hypothetical protein [Mycetohabitans rhizoxinica]|uniref:hypothetical protein n=1 Tax=Mycetohabitans rhizoxinica TaxID=412963 RepID=UPI0030D42C34